MKYKDKIQMIKDEMIEKTPDIDTQKIYHQANKQIAPTASVIVRKTAIRWVQLSYIGLMIVLVSAGFIGMRTTFNQDSDFGAPEQTASNEELYGFLASSITRMMYYSYPEYAVEALDGDYFGSQIVEEFDQFYRFFPLIEHLSKGRFTEFSFLLPSDKPQYSHMLIYQNSEIDQSEYLNRIYYRESYVLSGDVEIQFLVVTSTSEFRLVATKYFSKNPKEVVIKGFFDSEDESNYIQITNYPNQHMYYMVIEIVEDNQIQFKSSIELLQNNSVVELKTLGGINKTVQFSIEKPGVENYLVQYDITHQPTERSSSSEDYGNGQPSDEQGTIEIYWVMEPSFYGYYYDIQIEEYEIRIIGNHKIDEQ